MLLASPTRSVFLLVRGLLTDWQSWWSGEGSNCRPSAFRVQQAHPDPGTLPQRRRLRTCAAGRGWMRSLPPRLPSALGGTPDCYAGPARCPEVVSASATATYSWARTILHPRSHEPNIGSRGRLAARPKSQKGCCVVITDTNAPIQLRTTGLRTGSADGAMCLPGGSTKTAQ